MELIMHNRKDTRFDDSQAKPATPQVIIEDDINLKEIFNERQI